MTVEQVSTAQLGLKALGIQRTYEGLGSEILREFVLPALGQATRYDRLTGYFTIGSLAAVSEGLETLWRRGGQVRLVLGIHQVPSDLLDAARGAWPENVINGVRARLIENAGTLGEELLRDRIATLAWMLKDGLLEVRIAAPRQAMTGPTGIFHNKRMVFEDGLGNAVSASGSLNETVPGLGPNSEELVVHMSWAPGGLEYVEEHKRSFDRIWTDNRADLHVRPLDASFADELLTALGRPTTRQPAARPPSIAWKVLETVRASPMFQPHSLGSAALFAHQERAFMDALQRWPVRVLLADEVGLGKTLEAGAIASWMIRSGAAKRVVILAPKSVIKQWQDELHHHFGLSAWVYNSAAKRYEDRSGRSKAIPTGASVYGAHAPDLCLISQQIARGRRGGDHAFSRVRNLPDLLLVDEAHAARVRRTVDGSLKPTLLHQVLEELAPKIPHVVLLTATPLQLDLAEYHSILGILGLPPSLQTLPAYTQSLRVLAGGPDEASLDSARQAADWLTDIQTSLGWMPEGLTDGEAAVLAEVRRTSQASAFQKANALRRRWPDAFRLLLRAHPANLLTIRNTRAVLETYGYKFPKRSLEAPALRPSKPVVDFYSTVERYLAEAYGRTEQAAFPERRMNLGFAKSSYHQRLASSLHAARISLLRRLSRVDNLRARGLPDPTEEEEDEGDDNPAWDTPGEIAAQNAAAVAAAATVEKGYISDLMAQLDALSAQSTEPDPKLVAMGDLLEKAMEKDKVLVFSRYTDTLDRCVTYFRTRFGARTPGHALYTGQASWVNTGDEEVPVTKEGVRQALEDGKARVVFCSDAASEGLNLQAARILINVDVPWNPARLEQRIGRVARLGQKAGTVDIYNLWYPESVEARMYGRLLARHDLYQLAIGEAPELFAAAIRAEVESRLGHGDGPTPDVLADLQQERQSLQHHALNRVWTQGRGGFPESTGQRQRLIEVLTTAARRQDGATKTKGERTTIEIAGRTYHVSAEPGRSDSMTFHHTVWELLRTANSRTPAGLKAHVLSLNKVPQTVALQSTAGWNLVTPDNIAPVLAWMLGGVTCDLGAPMSGESTPAELGKAFMRAAVRWPLNATLRPLAQATPAPPPYDSADGWAVEPLGAA